MLNTWAFEKVAILVISFVGGFLFYNLISPESRLIKRHQMDQMLTFLINFVISIWIAKVVLNISLLFEDPFAVFAYPSDKRAFYLGLFIMLIYEWYRSMRGKTDPSSFKNVFVPTLIGASFVYEFLQIIWQKNVYMMSYFIILIVLLIIYIVSQKSKFSEINLLIFALWTIGLFVISLIKPYITFFGYILAPWFIAVATLLVSLFFVLNIRRRVST